MVDRLGNTEQIAGTSITNLLTLKGGLRTHVSFDETFVPGWLVHCDRGDQGGLGEGTYSEAILLVRDGSKRR